METNKESSATTDERKRKTWRKKTFNDPNGLLVTVYEKKNGYRIFLFQITYFRTTKKTRQQNRPLNTTYLAL